MSVAVTMADWVKETFFKKVIGLRGQQFSKVPAKLNLSMTLADFAPKDRPEMVNYWVDLFIDTIEREFGVKNPKRAFKNSKPLQDMNVGEILAWLENEKKLHSRFGNRPIKKQRHWG